MVNPTIKAICIFILDIPMRFAYVQIISEQGETEMFKPAAERKFTIAVVRYPNNDVRREAIVKEFTVTARTATEAKRKARQAAKAAS